MTRRAAIARHTTDTQIGARLVIDATGIYEIATWIRFLDHGFSVAEQRTIPLVRVMVGST